MTAAQATAALPERFNFAQHLISLNTGRGEKIAYIDDHGPLSYAALEESVRRCASALSGLAVRRDERALLFMHDCSDWPIAFLGALYAGITPVAVNTLLSAEDYAYMLAHSRAQVAIVSAALLPMLRAAMANGPHELKHIIVSRATDLEPNTVDFEAWISSATPAANAANTAADEPGFWLYSSGSTGRPKAAVHTNANLYWTAALYAEPILGLTEIDVCFSAAKLFFAYGLGNALTFPLSVGATTILMAERATPDACFKRFTALKTTVFFGAPTGFAGMLASASLPPREQVALRMCSSAGEALPREIGEKFTSHFGAQIIDGIGSTEMLHIFLSNRPGDVRYGTTGKAVPGYAVELRDENGAVLAGSDEIGDLYINGPSSALMYWGNRAKSVETFRGAWTKSGDKYFRDADGYYVYAGRSDDMLKVSGQYVSPFEVESTLMQHASVLESAVIGVEDENGLTRSKAFVVLKDAALASDALSDELKAFVKARLAPHKYPRQLDFVPELPKTATGKIQRFRLRDQEKSRAQSS